MTSVLVMQLWPHVISWCSLFWFCASKKGGVDGSGQAKSWHTVHMVAVLAGCRKTMVSFVPRRHLRERVWWHLGWLLSGEKFLSAKSHCRKNNLQCTTGNSWLLQQGDTALFWRVNLLSVLNYAYASHEFLMKPKKSAGVTRPSPRGWGLGTRLAHGWHWLGHFSPF